VRRRVTLVVGLAALLAVTAAGGGLYYLRHHNSFTPRPAPKTAVVLEAPAPTPSFEPTPVATATPAPTPTPLPDSVRLNVPFTVQAPFANWDREHEEYCEAAALLMVRNYYRKDGRANLPPAEADRDMTSIVAHERKTFPGVLDLPLSDMAVVGGALDPPLQGEVARADPDDIKRDLANGWPVIIPVMTHGGPGGQKIKPYYGATNVYHVILLIGYDASGQLITNDAGIKEGQYLTYSWDVLSTAMDAQAQRFGQGRVMLVFRPKS
jgi:hypothetical protein